MGLTALVARKALVFPELRPADDLTQQAPVLVCRGGDGDLAVFGIEDIEWAEEGMGGPERAGVLAAVGVEIDVVLAEAENGVVHGHVEELALPCLAGVDHGGEDADGGERAGHDVADAWAAAKAAAPERAGHADEAAHRLGDDVVGGPVGVGAGAGARDDETTDRCVDQNVTLLMERYVREAEVLHQAGDEVCNRAYDFHGL